MSKIHPHPFFAAVMTANRQDLDAFFSGPIRLLCVLSMLFDAPTAALLERPAIRFFGRRFFEHRFRRAWGNRIRPEMESLGNELARYGAKIRGGEVLTRGSCYRPVALNRRLPA